MRLSSAIHREAHPHRFAVSWTISRSPGNKHGCHFYFAHYGIRVHQAPNTLIVWVPSEAHGTSLPDVHPDETTPTFYQRGLAFVTSVRIAGAWKEFQANQKTADEAAEMVEEGDGGDDDKYEFYK